MRFSVRGLRPAHFLFLEDFMKKEKEKKRRIDWRRTLRNNAYILGLIIKVCPGVFRISMLWTVVGAVHSFFINTYLYKYALNALQEGLDLRAILITLGAMFTFSLLYRICDHGIGVYFKLRYPIVEAYIQDLLHKKAAEVDLECFENSSFYDTRARLPSTARISGASVCPPTAGFSRAFFRTTSFSP